jgi:hypothetical protein
MGTQLYRLVFAGKTRIGEDVSHVQSRLAALLRTDSENIKKLFSGKPRVLKSGLDENQAQTYRKALEKTGALCFVEKMKAAAEPCLAEVAASAGEPVELAAPLPREKMIQCPSCSFEQEEVGGECRRCGILFHKLSAAKKTASEKDQTGEILGGRPKHFIDEDGWKSLGVGLVMASVFMYVPVLKQLFIYMAVLFHEFGHCLVGWLFGYPSIPAFNFMEGGGVALSFERNMLIVALVYAGFGGLFYLYRQNRLTLSILALIVATYSFFAFSPLHIIIRLFMGNGTETVFACIFLYRAISSVAIVIPIERPLYACFAFFLLFHNFEFAYKLLNDSFFRAEYMAGTRMAYNDFDLITDYLQSLAHLQVNLRQVSTFFALYALALPVLTVIVFYGQEVLLRPVLEPIPARNDRG